MEPEELEELIKSAIQPGFRDRLLSRGQARSIMWKDGVLPDDSPRFIDSLSYDLLAYGDTLLSLAMSLKEQKGNLNLARAAFVQAGEAIESVVSKGKPNRYDRDFQILLSASGFHLGNLSARAFSMLENSLSNEKLSPIYNALALLILRSLDQLESDIFNWRLTNHASDENLMKKFNSWFDSDMHDEDYDQDFVDDLLDIVLADTYFSGVGHFLSALKTGDGKLIDEAKTILANGLQQCTNVNFVSHWWCFRLTIHIIDDLWRSSFHQILPNKLPNGESSEWKKLRALFIASLYCRKRSEIELWPSQLEAAKRSVDISDDLVVSLPTSAGKTRIAELCILRCLAEKKRIVFVTPLRALSAQTEVSLQRTFGRLGIKISTLYGSIGTSNFENDALRSRHIVVATPEKLDFALRNDPTIIDDVGLIVLDEGHMIGFDERKVRFEIQIQRLLKRADADNRRIICLSAVLPDAEESADFVNWIRRDKEGELISSDWRPTRIRFGTITWRGNHARLDLRMEDEKAYVENFINQKSPISGKRTELFPRDQNELVLATAWRFVEDGQSVLIYCPQRNSVESLAKKIEDLSKKGFLDSVLSVDQNIIDAALSIGSEWLGDEHPILRCLELGVAIHHGALPKPFRKEIERLLREGSLRITVSSPTLSQGLNLSATTIIMQDIKHRRTGNWNLIEASEFKNVIGRAGRAFVDVEGLVVFPIFKNNFLYNQRHDRRMRYSENWVELIDSTTSLKLDSGLALLVIELLVRLQCALGKPNVTELQEYIVNNADAWEFPLMENEDDEIQNKERQNWDRNIALMDTAILSLLGDKELDISDISTHLDDILSSSLWQRLLDKQEKYKELFSSSLTSRAQVIWRNSTAPERKGYFFAGVGLSTGKLLDEIAQQANLLLVQAAGAIINQELETFINSVENLAEMLFEIHPFIPDPFPENWRDILRIWLSGDPIPQKLFKVNEDTLRFLENGIVYKLPWGIEAIRVRALANRDMIGEGPIAMTIDLLDVHGVYPAIETGTINMSAALLMQAGFNSRIGSIRAVEETNATFLNLHELSQWLDSESVLLSESDENWPTVESRKIWNDFRNNFKLPEKQFWSRRKGQFPVNWLENIEIPISGSNLMLHVLTKKPSIVMSTGFDILGKTNCIFTTRPSGIFKVNVIKNKKFIEYEYLGPDDLYIETNI